MVKLGFITFAALFACAYGGAEDIQQNIPEVKLGDKLPEEKERSGGYGHDFSLYDVISLVYRKECKRELFTKADEEKTLHLLHELFAKPKPISEEHHSGHYHGHYVEHFAGHYGSGGGGGHGGGQPIIIVGRDSSGSDEHGSHGGGSHHHAGSDGGGSQGGGQPIIIVGGGSSGSHGGGSNHHTGSDGGGSQGGAQPIIIVGGGSSESDEHGSHGGGHYGGGNPIIIGGGYDDDGISFGYCKKLALELADTVHHKSFIKVDCHVLKKCLKILIGH